ncbi:MAG: tRNA (adenosine(37)-N6)-dimethylallyltransferase MiaA [Oscillospiraceae bacterium]|nr:tRNA (adenosine(37)-N6)-dimethylallyltransferase MiaA [Oscillospiraceae bacterium]
MPPKVVCVVGPTGCGKTKMGVLLAKAFDGEVVSCDSMQLYRGMVIGTAAPTEAEMEGIPHHMVGVAAPTEDYSAARYAAEARACVDDILARGKLPIIVGGTGLYMDALLRDHGFAAGQSGGEVRKELYERLAKEGIEPLWAELEQIDPESAARLHKNDEKRILRALEVYRETGRTISQHNEETKDAPLRYEPIYLGFAYAEREKMKQVIDLRVDKMMAEGLLEEVETLLQSGIPASATALQAIGYKECLAVFSGEKSAQEASDEVQLRSRQYAKRQLTWLRRNKDIHWFFWSDSRDFEAALAFSTKILADHAVS